MSKAAIARLIFGIAGTAVTGCAATATGLGTGATVFAIVVAFVVSSVLAEAAFRAWATPEEIRRDLEDRVRNSD